MSDALLSIENLRVQFGRFLAVDDVSLELHGGQLLGMIGPNGAGKTTTLRSAAGLQPITTGRIRVLGRDVFREPEFVGHHIGFTADNPALYDNITVEQHLGFIARCYGLSTELSEQRIDHWLETLWLGDRKTSKIASLSRGMKQRLGVARTLIPNPNVVLLDEPAAGLDPAGRVQFRLMLASLRDQGKALIVSSHILADLEEYCTHIAIMGHGKILKIGTAAQVAGHLDASIANYRVVLAHRLGDLPLRKSLVPEAVIEGGESDEILTVQYAPGREAAAALLKKLVAAGFPIAEFRVLAPDLEQAYLRTGIRQVD